MTPYFDDGRVQLYNADWRESEVPKADAVITDPPYGETTLSWDRWPAGWPSEAAKVAPALWCFGSLRLFMAKGHEFGDAGWKFSHDVVWAKTRGSSLARDKFARAHELVGFWYQGKWAEVRHQVPRVPSEVPHRGKRNHGALPHMGIRMDGVWVDDGTRMQTSVIKVRSELRRTVHPTQKPISTVLPLIEYSVPPEGLVVDLFSGSGTVAVAARRVGRRCAAYEVREEYCEAAAKRLESEVATLEIGAW